MFLPLSVQWLPAQLQLTQNGAARRGGGGGGGGGGLLEGSEGVDGTRG